VGFIYELQKKKASCGDLVQLPRIIGESTVCRIFMVFNGEVTKICRESMRFVKIGPVESTLHKGVNKFLTELPMSLDRFGMKFHLVDLHLMPFSSYDFNENG